MKYVLNHQEYIQSIVIGAIEQSLIPNSVGQLEADQVQIETVGNGGVLITIPDGEPKAKRGRRVSAGEGVPPEATPSEPAAAASPAPSRRRRNNGAAATVATESDDVFDTAPTE